MGVFRSASGGLTLAVRFWADFWAITVRLPAQSRTSPAQAAAVCSFLSAIILSVPFTRVKVDVDTTAPGEATAATAESMTPAGAAFSAAAENELSSIGAG